MQDIFECLKQLFDRKWFGEKLASTCRHHCSLLDVSPEAGHDNELVLVIDDEASIRQVMNRQTLETFGYRVVTADGGSQALSCSYQMVSTPICPAGFR